MGDAILCIQPPLAQGGDVTPEVEGRQHIEKFWAGGGSDESASAEARGHSGKADRYTAGVASSAIAMSSDDTTCQPARNSPSEL